MGLAEKIREQFTLPTIAETLAGVSYHIDGSEDARLMNSYPKLSLGTVEDSHDISDAVGIYVRGGRCEISAFLPRNHMIVVGETGSAKTSFLLRLISELARRTDWYIWVVDGKGDIDFAHNVWSVLYPYRGEIPIVQVGTGEQGALFHGLTGDALAVCNAVLKLTGAHKYSDAARHWANDLTLSAQALCGVLIGSPVSPPRSFAEIEQRLSTAWLTATYAGYNRYHIIEKLIKPTPYGIPYENFAGELQPVLNVLSKVVHPTGRSFPDGCIHFQLCVPNASEPAKRFFAFKVEAMKSQMIEMKKRDKKGIVIIDEHPAFEGDDIKGLLSMARSFGVGVVFVAQSPVSLGEEHIKNLLMANTTTIVSFRVPYPGSEDISRIAGTVKVPHVSMKLEDGQVADSGMIGEKETWNIPSGSIAQLPTGHAYIIRAQKWVKVHFDRTYVPQDVPPPPTYTAPLDTFVPIPKEEQNKTTRKTPPPPQNPKTRRMN